MRRSVTFVIFFTLIATIIMSETINSPNEVRIYNGPGTSFADVMIRSFAGMLPGYRVRAISADQLYTQSWQSQTKLLVIPGGADIPYTKNIRGVAIQNIRKFIKNGGSYVGICAGAYFSCSRVTFEKGTPMEVVGDRELNLFHGTANGSVYPGYDHKSAAGQRMVTLNLPEDNTTAKVYFDGGCEFIPDKIDDSNKAEDVVTASSPDKSNTFNTELPAIFHEKPNEIALVFDFNAPTEPEFKNTQKFETLATYAEFSPPRKAVVFLRRGKGRVLLSGVHPEMDSGYLRETRYTRSQWDDIVRFSPAQRTLFKRLLRKLMVL